MSTETIPVPIDLIGAGDTLTRQILAEELEHGYTIGRPHLQFSRPAGGAGWRSFEILEPGAPGAELRFEERRERISGGDTRKVLRILDGTLEEPIELRIPFYFSELAAALEAALERRRALRPVVTVYRRTLEPIELGDGEIEYAEPAPGDGEEERHELEADLELEETLESVAADLLEDLGATEPSSGPGAISSSDWFSAADMAQDYRTGALEDLSAHISGGLSPESVRQELERRTADRRRRRETAR